MLGITKGIKWVFSFLICYVKNKDIKVLGLVKLFRLYRLLKSYSVRSSKAVLTSVWRFSADCKISLKDENKRHKTSGKL